MGSYLRIISIIYFISLFINIKSEDIIVRARDINSTCEKNLFKIIIEVDFSKIPDEYYSFYLQIKYSKDLLFKCIIDPSLKQIICITNLEQQKTDLKIDDYISLPYPFPEVKGIIWNYMSFLFLVYRRVIDITEQCGEPILKTEKNWDLITKVNKIYGGKCLLSGSEDNFYSFDMNLNIVAGNLKDSLDKAKKEQTNFKIELMQNISLPLLLGELKILKNSKVDSYVNHIYYKYAFCYPKEEINQKNYLKEEGLEFHCNIPIVEQGIFNGPVKVITFSDNIYSSMESNNEKNIHSISIYFGVESNPTLKDNNINDPNSISNDVNQQQGPNDGNKSEDPYLLLDNRVSNYICPDKPVFEISNIQKGIIYEPVSNDDNKINLILSGYLKNGYQITENNISLLEYTPNEIHFNLSISNNLIEDSEIKRSDISCILSAGTFFLNNELTEIKCVGNKGEQKNIKNTDITINWAYKNNKYLNDIIIQWPKEYGIHSKKIYSYHIAALSIKKSDYDCFDNKYFFYINILDLNSEPEISFEMPMKLPYFIYANCKLYTSNSLKCYLDLRLRKIKKGYQIKLPDPGNYNISTRDGNYINLTVLHFSDENNTEIGDEGIYTDESCGDNVLIGAIKDIGYTYAAAVGILVAISAIFGLIFLFVGLCIIYEIKHRNRKGEYFAHTEEKKGGSKSEETNQNINVSSAKK